MIRRLIVCLIAVAVWTGCDSTPGINPFAECLVVFTTEPEHIEVVRGDSALLRARRVGFCDQQRTLVSWRVQDSLVATFRAASDSSAFIRGAGAGSTVLTVIDQLDTLHRAGVNVLVRP